jgi:hypothetical protein
MGMSKGIFDAFRTNFLRFIDVLPCIIGFIAMNPIIHRRTDDTNSLPVANDGSNPRRRSGRACAIYADAGMWRAVAKKDLASGWQFLVVADDDTDRMSRRQGISGSSSGEHFWQCCAE